MNLMMQCLYFLDYFLDVSEHRIRHLWHSKKACVCFTSHIVLPHDVLSMACCRNCILVATAEVSEAKPYNHGQNHSHKTTRPGKAPPLFNQNVVRGRWRSYSIQHTTDTRNVHHIDSRITKKYKLSQVNKGRINLTLHTDWVTSSTVRTKYMSPMLLWFLMLKRPRAASSTILYVSWPLGVSCENANLLWLQILKEMTAYNNSNGNWDVFYKIHLTSKTVSSSRTFSQKLSDKSSILNIKHHSQNNHHHQQQLPANSVTAGPDLTVQS